jgi:hypothetical protein
MLEDDDAVRRETVDAGRTFVSDMDAAPRREFDG